MSREANRKSSSSANKESSSSTQSLAQSLNPFGRRSSSQSLIKKLLVHKSSSSSASKESSPSMSKATASSASKATSPSTSKATSPSASKATFPSASKELNEKNSRKQSYNAIANRPSNYTQSSWSAAAEEQLRRNHETITRIRDRLSVGRKQTFYFLKIPGLVRLAQMLLSVLHIAIFAHFATYYESSLSSIVPPYYLCTTREQFFFIANYHTLIGTVTIVLSGVFSARSNAAMLSSIYPLIFDVIQCLMIGCASVALIIDYNDKEVVKVMTKGLNTKYAIAFSGVFLSTLHIVESIYDFVIYDKYKEVEMEMEEDERNLISQGDSSELQSDSSKI